MHWRADTEVVKCVYGYLQGRMAWLMQWSIYCWPQAVGVDIKDIRIPLRLASETRETMRPVGDFALVGVTALSSLQCFDGK